MCICRLYFFDKANLAEIQLISMHIQLSETTLLATLIAIISMNHKSMREIEKRVCFFDLCSKKGKNVVLIFLRLTIRWQEITNWGLHKNWWTYHTLFNKFISIETANSFWHLLDDWIHILLFLTQSQWNILTFKSHP